MKHMFRFRYIDVYRHHGEMTAVTGSATIIVSTMFWVRPIVGRSILDRIVMVMAILT